LGAQNYRNISEKPRCAVFIDFTRGNAEHKCDDRRLLGLDQISVDQQEGEGGKKARPFVPI